MSTKGILFPLFFLSGASALIYEVLWLKELGLLFGNTAYAAATTLAVFFLGMAAGSWAFGRRAEGLKRPLRSYALLEVGIAGSALLYFLLLRLFQVIYPTLYGLAEGRFLPALFVKFLLALLVLFPPAFFMGGTLPVMGQHLIRRSSELGRTGTLLYGINTLGATGGALAAGFVLPPILGFTRAYLVAIALNLIAACGAWIVDKHVSTAACTVHTVDEGVLTAPNETSAGADSIIVLAFLSGFLALGLEVIWTRMFAQVLHNSVYSFAAILATFLAALALGSVLAHLLCRFPLARPDRVLAVLAVCGFCLTAASPVLFVHFTGGLAEISSDAGWSKYLGRVFGLAAGIMLAPAILIGSIYPYLLKASEWTRRAPGSTLGRLASVNSVGGILGSLLAGFVLLAAVGLWRSLWILASGYLVIAVIALTQRSGGGKTVRLFALGAAATGGFVLPVLMAPGLPVVRVQAERGESIVEVREGRHGTVAVLSDGKNRWLTIDNHYTLGDLKSLDAEARQSQIPLFVQARPGSVFFLGMGTGITAGAALSFPVRRVVVCELLPEVVEAARRHFADCTNGLFTDPRSVIVVEDGRQFLAGTRETFDLIISDLFVPWHAGTGSLYTREHFEICRSRLSPGGLFVQWVPACQLSRKEFDMIARTVLDVFPHVTVWRGEMTPTWPTLAFLCTQEPTQLDPVTVRANLAHVIPLRESDRVTDSDVVPYIMYAGNLGRCRHLFAGERLNTDDRPVIEYLSPITQQEAGEREIDWLASYALVSLFEQLFAEVPPESDPYLARLNKDQLAYVRAGLQLYTAGVHIAAGRPAEAAPVYREFLAAIPFDIYPGLAGPSAGRAGSAQPSDTGK